MSASTSPSHYTEDAFVSDANFKVEINQKMKVPDKISFNTDVNGMNQAWIRDNINMHVPERILVVGREQTVGTRAPPREITFDNSLLQTDPYPGDMRVATPPRTLTLDKYPFPGLEELEEPELRDELPVVKINKKARFNDSDLNLTLRESTPPLGSSGERLTPAEEVLHLRRQMAKLNRRVIALELENLNRLQKEKFVLGFGVAYLLLKVIIWMNRD